MITFKEAKRAYHEELFGGAVLWSGETYDLDDFGNHGMVLENLSDLATTQMHMAKNIHAWLKAHPQADWPKTSVVEWKHYLEQEDITTGGVITFVGMPDEAAVYYLIAHLISEMWFDEGVLGGDESAGRTLGLWKEFQKAADSPFETAVWWRAS